MTRIIRLDDRRRSVAGPTTRIHRWKRAWPADSVGLLGGTVLGISCVAPAYTLTATIGLVAAVAGVKMPIIFIAGFIPMFFAAYAYREFNKVDPDCGTSFTWTTRAFGPYVGWLGGWAAILATIIVLANLAGIGVQFFYQLLGSVFNNPDLGDLWTNKFVNVGDLPGLPGRRPPPLPIGGSPPPKRCSSCWSSSSSACCCCSRSWPSQGRRTGRPGPASPFSWDWFNPFTGLTV